MVLFSSCDFALLAVIKRVRFAKDKKFYQCSNNTDKQKEREERSGKEQRRDEDMKTS